MKLQTNRDSDIIVGEDEGGIDASQFTVRHFDLVLLVVAGASSGFFSDLSSFEYKHRGFFKTERAIQQLTVTIFWTILFEAEMFFFFQNSYCFYIEQFIVILQRKRISKIRFFTQFFRLVPNIIV